MLRPDQNRRTGLSLLLAALLLGGCSWLHRAPPPTAPVPAPPPAEPVPDPTVASTPELPPAVAPSTPRKPDRAPKKPAPTAHDALGLADVGYYMDVLHGHLMQVVGSSARIERRGEGIVLWVPYLEGFEPGTAKLSTAGRARLKPLAEALATFRLTMLSVQLRGEEASAIAPGEPLRSQRLGAVARYLADAGVAGRRITTGPGASGQSPTIEASALDRLQLEFELTPLTAAGASTL